MLKELLEKYNQLNIEAIDAVEKDDVDKLSVLLNEKDFLIKKIDDINYTSETQAMAGNDCLCNLLEL